MIYKGVEIQTHRGADCEATAEAPKGLRFVSGPHESVHGLMGSDRLPECVAAVKRDIDEGFEKCTDADCEWCQSP